MDEAGVAERRSPRRRATDRSRAAARCRTARRRRRRTACDRSTMCAPYASTVHLALAHRRPVDRGVRVVAATANPPTSASSPRRCAGRAGRGTRARARRPAQRTESRRPACSASRRSPVHSTWRMLGSTTTFSAASEPLCRTRPGASVERAPPWLPGVRSGSGPLVPQLGTCLGFCDRPDPGSSSSRAGRDRDRVAELVSDVERNLRPRAGPASRRCRPDRRYRR